MSKNHNEVRVNTETFSDNSDHLNPTIVYPLQTGYNEDSQGDATTTSSSDDSPTPSAQLAPHSLASTHLMVTKCKNEIFKTKVYLMDYT